MKFPKWRGVAYYKKKIRNHLIESKKGQFYIISLGLIIQSLVIITKSDYKDIILGIIILIIIGLNTIIFFTSDTSVNELSVKLFFNDLEVLDKSEDFEDSGREKPEEIGLSIFQLVGQFFDLHIDEKDIKFQHLNYEYSINQHKYMVSGKLNLLEFNIANHTEHILKMVKLYINCFKNLSNDRLNEKYEVNLIYIINIEQMIPILKFNLNISDYKIKEEKKTEDQYELDLDWGNIKIKAIGQIIFNIELKNFTTEEFKYLKKIVNEIL
ncbi:MAG: hypothetical protein HeimC3_39750 [Candidatus Heimdallarchaeota archaeon LC_3]|nr:MAG: hypothetical protein HeimC3_39750 [Candidatus Heimdallarchaeota archaeon LC_3]